MTGIRPFRPGDAGLFAEYCAALSPQTTYFFLPHALDRATCELLTAPEACADPATRRYMAFERTPDGERMTGYYFFRFFDRPVPIFAVGVRDDAQNRGVGRAMVMHALLEAEKAGRDGVRLTTFKDNIRAQHLYRSCGFTIRGTDPATGEWELYRMFGGRPMPEAWSEGDPQYPAP